MDLYFSPLSCSMATRICFYEAGAEARYIEVDTKAGRTADGADFSALNPMGRVPTLRTDTGELLTENAAVLQHVAARLPGPSLAPVEDLDRVRAWLSFIGTELHASLFRVLLDPRAPDAVKTYAMARGRRALDRLAAHLTDREHVLDRFSVVDAYLVTVLGWMQATPLAITEWPALAGYAGRISQRPSVARALREERALYFAR